MEPMSPTEYDVLPRQWVTIKHPRFGDVIAAMQPYPTLDEGALCAGDPAWTDDGEMQSSIKRGYMKSVCSRCPIEIACREYGVAHEGYGIWGGTMPDERAAIRRERKQIMVEPHAAHQYGLTDDYFPMLSNLAGGRGERNATGQTIGTSGGRAVAERSG